MESTGTAATEELAHGPTSARPTPKPFVLSYKPFAANCWVMRFVHDTKISFPMNRHLCWCRGPLTGSALFPAGHPAAAPIRGRRRWHSQIPGRQHKRANWSSS
ncbi:hypothetical protein GCM10009662_10100 [Catellatospora coxensis]|uniref:Uncharacterized protein n=1 Tax=Catellatospora coxensis TaxID=310354 RepID=A0A8J3KXB0_9ACTN|nr:hypothetical protein Cco03nite_37340 [Catellatospora coxensis]